MKLLLERAPDSYTEDKAAILIDVMDDGKVITVGCENAHKTCEQIARAVNRDKCFDAMVSALTPFRSTELGGRLVDMIDIREKGGEMAQMNLIRLIAMVDVILDAAERANDDPIDL